MGSRFRRALGSKTATASVAVAVGCCMLSFVAALAGLMLPGAASAASAVASWTGITPTRAHELGYSLTPSTVEPYALCHPSPEHVQCMTIVDPLVVETSSGYRVDGTGPLLEGGGEKGGLDPENLQSAYKILPKKEGSPTETVAVIDAYGYEDAESDLIEYRDKYKLGACEKGSGCFKKVNEEGKEPTFTKKEEEGELEKEWTAETALDLDMVSAACPECHILLVEATEQSMKDLAAATEEAYKLGASEISNSYGTPEDDPKTCPNKEGCKEYLGDYDHPGIPITVASGDEGYDDDAGAPSWPASSSNVIAVGGTTLTKESNARGWKESVWKASGSGCSLIESKPPWQTDWGCAKRTDNDTAAVANNEASPVSVYNTPYYKGWEDVGGTSAAAPLVAGIEAHAGSTVKDEGAEAFYRSSLFDVTAEADGLCDPPADEYLCTAEEGYDGPTGWGAPDSPLESAQTFQAVTGEATGISEQKATLNGYVYPNGVKTTYKFEYGETTSYGKTVSLSGSSSSVVWQSVSASVSALEPEVTYHYRLVANNGTETKYGADHTLTTSFWQIQKTASLSGNDGGLRSVSCISPMFCMAVGHESGTTNEVLIETWNGTSWSVQTAPMPKTEEKGELNGVSCASSTACMAVGVSTGGLLTEHWNGEKWSAETMSSPKIAEASSFDLSAVSCTSAERCTAVGKFWLAGRENGMFAELWNGKEWAAQTISTLAGTTVAELQSVSCGSSSSCIAVGFYDEPEKESKPEFYGAFAVQWSGGSEWAKPETLNPAGVRVALLASISCFSSTRCVAVGYDSLEKSSVENALAESWNGTKWSIEEPPTSRVEDTRLYAVSCPSSTVCTAVGTYQTRRADPLEGIPSASAVLIDALNGSQWSISPSVESVAEGSSALKTLSCVSTIYCTAIGEGVPHEYSPTLEEVPPAEILGESRVLPVPVVETKAATGVGETGATLKGDVNPEGFETKYYFEYGTTTSYGSKTAEASAGSGASGVEVSKAITGLVGNTKYHYRIVATNGGGPLAEGADHTFTTGAKPSVESKGATTVRATAATLNGVVNPERLETTYHFEYGKTTSYGTSVPVPSAGVGAGESSLEESKTITGLELSTTYHFRIVATNSAGTTDGADKTFTTLASASWRIASTPNPSGEKKSRLEGISCTTPGACTAVGYYENSSSAELALVEAWNGEEWKEQVTPKPTGAKDSELYGVSCTSTGACTAVGSYLNSSSVAVPLAERWNGEAWSVQEPPAPAGAKESGLFGVSCTSSSVCTAVGGYVNSAGVYVAFAESWNGTSWSIKETPVPTGTKLSQLIGVSCSAADACTAVGEYESNAEVFVALAESWNGEAWSLQEPPSPKGATLTWPEGVSCTSSSMCVMVGLYEPSAGGSDTLAEEWNGKAWSVQSIPNPSGAQNSRLHGVSCASSTTCTVVGFYDYGEPTEELTLAERWNGTEWSIQSTPNPTGAPYSRLRGVSCTSSTTCASVGWYFKSKGEENMVTLAEIYG
jgi:hypothetical protein